MHHEPEKKFSTFLPLFLVLFFGGITIYQMWRITLLSQQVTDLQDHMVFVTTTLTNTSKGITHLKQENAGISDTLNNTKQNVEAVKSQVGGVVQKVGSIAGTVDNLERLSQVDPQLLKKYSKVYFLSDNYTPAHLLPIPTDNTYSSAKQEQFLAEALPFLQAMLYSANKDGVTLYVKSGYRSFAEQKSLKSAYSVIYGAGTANAFSADQGYSEHQLGTTVDFITKGLGGALNGFDKTEAYTWLTNNAYRYGFVLSYPKGNKYYIYEPWHWRYVGTKLASYLHYNNLNFYDMDQREIDKYLVNFLDGN